MSDTNTSAPSDNSNSSLQELARLLVIAKGVDFDVLDEETQNRVSGDILEIYFSFIDEMLSQTKNPELLGEWNLFKESSFSPEIYSNSKYLQRAIISLSELFLKSE